MHKIVAGRSLVHRTLHREVRVRTVLADER